MLRLWCVFCILGGLALSQEAPVGIVTTTQGDSKIFEPHGKGGRALEIADVLTPGSRIVTGANGKASFVSCAQSSSAQAQPSTEIVFSTGGFQVKRGQVSREHKVPSCHIPPVNVGGRDAHIGGVNMRGEATMQLLSPVGTAVDPEKVTFRWQPVDGATIYRVAVRDSNGSDLWESEAKSPSATYNGEKKLTPSGSYRWRVTALQGEEVLSSASARMDVLSAESLARASELRKQADGAETHLMLGMLYEELNAPDMALVEYLKVNGPRSAWLEEKIALLRAAEQR